MLTVRNPQISNTSAEVDVLAYQLAVYMLKTAYSNVDLWARMYILHHQLR